MNGTKICTLIFLVINALLVQTSYAEEVQAGKTLLATGSVMSKRESGDVILKRRSPVYERDEIHVGKGAAAQFRMADKAVISLEENSVLQIKKYQYKEGDASNSALMELLSGGLRTITGAIGKNNKKAYELRTPLATIGIRGTHYQVNIVPNGMYVSVWDGQIIVRSRLQGGCNILLGSNRPFQFMFVDRLGYCRGLLQAPQLPDINVIQQDRAVILPAYNAFAIDQSRPSQELNVTASELNSRTPTFNVGLDSLNMLNDSVADFQQSVGGYPVSWGFWGEFGTTDSSGTQISSGDDGLLWATYEPSGADIVGSRTGTFSRFDNVTDSLLRSSAGAVSNLQVQMDVNFDSGNVTNGALSANTTNETWVAVFDGKIQAGDLDLQMNGASVIDSDPNTPSPPREANGFIAGDFVGENAEAILGAFGLSEENNSNNNIQGLFILKE